MNKNNTISSCIKQTDQVLTTSLLGKESLQEIQNIWIELQSKISSVGLTTRWEWISTWLSYYGPVVNYWFVVCSVNNTPSGIALITKETHRPLPIPLKAFHIGTNGEPYKEMVRMVNNRILVQQEYKTYFYESIIEMITSQFAWEEINFDFYNEQESQILTALLAKKNLDISVNTEPCWLFNLDEPRKYKTDVLTQYSHSTRYAIRKTLLALDNNITVEWAETPKQALLILEELVRLYNKKWQAKGTKGMFASERFFNFHKTIIEKLIPTGDVVLLRVNNPKLGTIGCVYLLVDTGVAYGYQIGLDDFEDVQFPSINRKHFKPGFLVHWLCTEECLKRGLKAYNFSTGFYPYKKLLTNKEDTVTTISIRKPIMPYLRENIMKLHYRLIHNKTASFLIKPIRMIF
ncbi:MAG TPA: GNAT family N-acetyltransferase [Candidatus Woesebacteria bacterium]|nr:GNAT family N-acetyltransferase [Candidatus Woesebacteria bacterium]